MTIRSLRIEEIDRVNWFSFKFGTGDDFHLALERVKTIHPLERDWDSISLTWRVNDSPGNRAILAQAFSNFDSSLDAVLSQGSMF